MRTDFAREGSGVPIVGECTGQALNAIRVRSLGRALALLSCGIISSSDFAKRVCCAVAELTLGLAGS